jgi:hypothetical protein
MTAAITAAIDATEGLQVGGDFEKAVKAAEEINKIQALLPGHERLAYKLVAFALVVSLVAIIVVSLLVPPVFAVLLAFGAWGLAITGGLHNPLAMITTTALSISSALLYMGTKKGKAKVVDGFNLVVEAEVRARENATTDDEGDIFYPASGIEP